MAARYDAIVIGGGHNGLVCAAYLARARRKVLVLEAADRLGGAAATWEFAPGFRVSACAHILGQMQRGIIDDLGLLRHGLRFAATGMTTTALTPDGRPLTLGIQGITGCSAADAAAWSGFHARMRGFAHRLGAILGMTPPRLGTQSWADRRDLVRMAWQVRRLGRAEMRELLRIIGMNAYDLLEDAFESPLLKGALGFDAVLGANFGPRSPGTALTLLYRMAAEAGAGTGLAQPLAGMGAVADAIAASARAAGADIRAGAKVARILVDGDRAAGVILDSGEAIAAGAVISSADPRTTFLALLGAEYLDTGFVRRVDHFRHRGLAAKLHLALDGLPDFAGLEQAALGGRLIVAPALDYLEHAYNHAKYGEYSQSPALEITLPTVNDPALAPPGKHVLSAVVQYAPHDLAGGWSSQRERFADIVVATIARHAPGLERLITARELLTPVDIEREFRIAGGHWHHGDLAFDQFLMVRPVPGAAQYETPVEGLFLCGAGSHPGGGVMGVAGRNAARRVLRRKAQDRAA
jgi:phytoene dehydrogenase-like protein